MKGKKLCIGLLILFITCLLSLNLSLNASAAKITNLRREYIKSINFQTYGPNKTFNNQTIEQYVYSPVYDSLQENMPLAANNTFRASALQITLLNPITVNSNKYWELSFYVYVGTNQEFFIPTVLCPSFASTGMIIDSCETIYHDTAFETYQQNLNTGDFYGWNKTFVELKIKGHFTTTQTGDSFDLSGPFLTIKNTKLSGTYFGWRFLLAFDSFRTYQYVEEESPSDEAAEKELEDRDNIESQSSTTENQANNAGNAAQTTGTTLFGAFSQLFTALTNVNGNSCTLPNMQVYSLNLGQMNLCTYDIPPQIMALVSIGMVFIIVPLGIHLVKKMISLYKEITG